MKRGLKNYVSWKAVRHIAYLPLVVIAVKNWPEFLSNYLGLTHRTAVYTFRDGMDIFFRKDYGDLRDNAVVIDIGANIGVYAIFAAAKSKNARVFAFEPAPQEFRALTENVQINHLEKKIIASPLAITGKNETKKLFLNGGPHNSFYDHWENVPSAQVQCASLESVFKKDGISRCDMLKMDCEGSEFEILQSTPQAIFEKISAIRMEYHCPSEAPMTPDGLVAFLEQKRYRIVKRETATEDRGIIWAERK